MYKSCFINGRKNRQNIFICTTREKNTDLERRFEKNLNDVISFNISDENNKEMITYLKDKSRESKMHYKNHKMLTSILESVDTVVSIGSSATSVTLSVTGIGFTCDNFCRNCLFSVIS